MSTIAATLIIFMMVSKSTIFHSLSLFWMLIILSLVMMSMDMNLAMKYWFVYVTVWKRVFPKTLIYSVTAEKNSVFFALTLQVNRRLNLQKESEKKWKAALGIRILPLQSALESQTVFLMRIHLLWLMNVYISLNIPAKTK